MLFVYNVEVVFYVDVDIVYVDDAVLVIVVVFDVVVDMVFDDDGDECFCCGCCPDGFVSRSGNIMHGTYQHRYFTNDICG